jgi:uncharacterized protein
MSSSTPSPLNRLAAEKSLYLKQHENNPVDWYPWGEEALRAAKEKDLPILLSVGYSACHWCHVMAHETFENPEIAAVLNENFINIKIDREERPDLDQVYQWVAQAFTRGGGWPLTVFLTPDLKPFFGGTYFPPTDRYGRPGFKKLADALAKAWVDRREEVQENADRLAAQIQDWEKHGTGDALPPRDPDDTESLVERITTGYMRAVDYEKGGLSGAPKFPQSSIFGLIWRQYLLDQGPLKRDAVLETLAKMASGGIFDQLGGGFHRYSVDEDWLVPHFEKMLYDNALLLKLYSEVVNTAGADLPDDKRALFSRVIVKTLGYLEREMKAPDGFYYSTQDADTEGEEGKTFTWIWPDLEKVLSASERETLKAYFDIREEGNFEHGQTILTLRSGTDLTNPDLAALEEKLFAIRFDERPLPGRDEKKLTFWNALLLEGLVHAVLALQTLKLDEDANHWRKQTLNLAESLWAANEKVVYAQLEEDGQPGYLEDSAALAAGFLEVLRLDPERSSNWIARAEKIYRDALVQFSDVENPGLYMTRAETSASFWVRPKSLSDQATPSGASLLLRVGLLLRELAPEMSEANTTVNFNRQLEYYRKRLEEDLYLGGELASSLQLEDLGAVSLKLKRTVQGIDKVFSLPWIYPVSRGEQAASIEAEVCHHQTCQKVEAPDVELFVKTLFRLSFGRAVE